MLLWSDSLAVAGLAFLTLGTGAQAWATRTDFKTLGTAYAKVRQDEATANFTLSLIAVIVMWLVSTLPDNRTPNRSLNARLKVVVLAGWLIWRNATWSVLRWRSYARKIRAAGGEDAVDLGRLLRQTTVWAILCGGSVLVLAAALLALIHAA
jgi:hypothetical protein